MIVLALDTALSATSVAVLDGERALAVHSEPMERGHQERIAGIVRDVMAKAGVPFHKLDRIGVTVGPGSFTGLRVGLAFAKGAALALGIPCVGIGTLEALAASAGGSRSVAAAVDARRGQIYLQIFEDGLSSGAPMVLSVAEGQARLNQGKRPLSLIGSGAILLNPNNGLDRSDGMLVDHRLFPDPVVLGRLAARAPEPSQPPAPLYLRAPDAKTIAERSANL